MRQVVLRVTIITLVMSSHAWCIHTLGVFRRSVVTAKLIAVAQTEGTPCCFTESSSEQKRLLKKNKKVRKGIACVKLVLYGVNPSTKYASGTPCIKAVEMRIRNARVGVMFLLPEKVMPRVNISLTDDVIEVLDELTATSGGSRSSTIAEGVRLLKARNEAGMATVMNRKQSDAMVNKSTGRSEDGQ